MNHTVNEINKLQENQREIVKEFCSTQFDLEGLKRHILNSKFLEKFNINDVNEIVNKFFTNSKKIKFILDKISELNAFPRKVTLQQIGNKFELK